ncbi:MAG TPA: Calx-beta domain-containing protein, partial [Pyrinomonadaceae bacterium]|nr:Calx-beta domain-containing protein [Pyrinomonadaceae bacterium]
RVTLFSWGLNAVLVLSIVLLNMKANPATSKFRSFPNLAARKAVTGAEATSVAGKIAFASDRDGNFEIYLMDSDGGGQIRLTEHSAEDYSPAWSPEGTRLAFVSTRDGNAEIYLMNIDGTGQTRLTNNSAADLSPVWTPDGSQIAFVTNRDGNDEIYLMNADGSNQTNLTQNPADDISIAFSLTGTIAFSSDREDSQFDIYVMRAGTEVIRLTAAEGDDITPAWSEQRICFQTNRDDNDEVYTMAFDGSNQTRLTNNQELDVDPGQSSDGAKISFASARDGNLEIYLMNPDGSGLQRLTSNDAADLQPALEPRGVILPPPSPEAPIVQFAASDYSVDEGQLSATLTVTRSNANSAVAVDFATVNGTATNRTDYTYNFGTLRFAAGEASKNISVLITDDAFIEIDETLTVTLSNPSGAALGSLNTATLRILNNDSASPAVNPIDNARFFVNQHYLDFLNRAPDQGGLDYWTGQITGCGNNIPCLRSRRNGVSAAFFIESEFQLTGFFVYRLHKASFGSLPTRQQFITDRSRVRAGPTLETDKVTLANDFAMRDAFLTRYPSGLSPEEFVNKLFDTAGLIPFTAERQRLAQDMRNGKTRGQVLIEVIEIQQFKTNEFNAAFVLMQYFGYLGRDPEPDGFAFWLDVLNNREPNNYLGMVCSFITSTEYQERFSSVVTQNNSQCALP